MDNGQPMPMVQQVQVPAVKKNDNTSLIKTIVIYYHAIFFNASTF